MTRTDTTQENSRQIGFRLPYLFLAGILVAALLVLVALNLGTFIRSDGSQAQSAPLVQAPTITSGELYMMANGWDGYNHVLALTPDLGEVGWRFEAGYNAVVRLTADKHILYVYNQSHSENATQLKGGVSAIDVPSGTSLWQVIVPGEPFGPSTKSAWLSADEQRLYLMGSPDNLHPHIFAVDTQSGTLLHDFELSLPYPSNVDMAFPLAWKLSWNETLVVASRDQLFTFDLTSGLIGDAIQLFVPGSVYRVPLNLPHTTFVWDGAMDSDVRHLFLATSTQEILAVNLNTRPLTVTSVVALPTGWQYAVMQPFLYHPDEKAVYVQVRRWDAPEIFGGLIVEEIWRYETTTWTQTARLDLRDTLAQIPEKANDKSGELDLANYGLFLTTDGQVYSFNRQGLLRLSLEPDGRLHGTWRNLEEMDRDFWLIFAIP